MLDSSMLLHNDRDSLHYTHTFYVGNNPGRTRAVVRIWL